LGEACGTHRREEESIQRLVGKPERMRPRIRPRCRREDRTRMELRKVGGKGVERIHLAQDLDSWRALVNTVMYLRPLAPRNY
jgi:hypothetical protein